MTFTSNARWPKSRGAKGREWIYAARLWLLTFACLPPPRHPDTRYVGWISESPLGEHRLHITGRHCTPSECGQTRLLYSAAAIGSGNQVDASLCRFLPFSAPPPAASGRRATSASRLLPFILRAAHTEFPFRMPWRGKRGRVFPQRLVTQDGSSNRPAIAVEKGKWPASLFAGEGVKKGFRLDARERRKLTSESWSEWKMKGLTSGNGARRKAKRRGKAWKASTQRDQPE